MLFAFDTTAPRRHIPVATIFLILFTCIVSLQNYPGREDSGFEGMALQYGALTATQWFSALFVHPHFVPLIVNMLLLWTFGLVIEGAIGWWRFLTIYLGVGVLSLTMEQIAMLAFSSTTVAPQTGAAGATAAILGLVGAGLIWFPSHSVYSRLILGPKRYRWYSYFSNDRSDGSVWDEYELIVPFYFFAILFIAAAVLMQYWMSSFEISPYSTLNVLNAIGLLLGMLLGAMWLSLGWVDPQAPDLPIDEPIYESTDKPAREPKPSAVREKGRSPVESKRTAIGNAIRERLEKRRTSALDQIVQIIRKDQPEFALAASNRMKRELSDWQLPEKTMQDLIAALHRHKQQIKSLPLMIEYLRLYNPGDPAIRLAVAEVLIEHENRPAQAIRVLDRIPPGLRIGKFQESYSLLRATAEQKHREGEIEIAVEDI